MAHADAVELGKEEEYEKVPSAMQDDPRLYILHTVSLTDPIENMGKF